MTETINPLKQNKVVPIDQLMKHPDNYRIHSQIQINGLVASLQRFGQGRSIVVQDGPEGYLIVAGHGVVMAARQLKWSELRADILPADWSPIQIKGYLVADNLHSENAEDDMDMLTRLIKEQGQYYPLDTLGTDDAALQLMLKDLEETEDEEERVRTTELKEPEDKAIESGYSVLIECETEEEQIRAYDLCEREGFTCKVMSI